MTSEEVEKYINQLAFSGAEEFENTKILLKIQEL
jgi:HSP90 family molecular chaperone